MGSVLNPLQFVICINNINVNVGSMISEFADEANVDCVIDSEGFVFGYGIILNC